MLNSASSSAAAARAPSPNSIEHTPDAASKAQVPRSETMPLGGWVTLQASLTFSSILLIPAPAKALTHPAVTGRRAVPPMPTVLLPTASSTGTALANSTNAKMLCSGMVNQPLEISTGTSDITVGPSDTMYSSLSGVVTILTRSPACALVTSSPPTRKDIFPWPCAIPSRSYSASSAEPFLPTAKAPAVLPWASCSSWSYTA